MNYPDVYSEIDANEMVYIVGGSPDYMGLFNYLIGNYLRDAVLSDARSAVWNSAKKGSLTPMEDWMKNFWNMNIFAKTGYLYGDGSLCCSMVRLYCDGKCAVGSGLRTGETGQFQRKR